MKQLAVGKHQHQCQQTQLKMNSIAGMKIQHLGLKKQDQLNIIFYKKPATAGFLLPHIPTNKCIIDINQKAIK